MTRKLNRTPDQIDQILDLLHQVLAQIELPELRQVPEFNRLMEALSEPIPPEEKFNPGDWVVLFREDPTFGDMGVPREAFGLRGRITGISRHACPNFASIEINTAGGVSVWSVTEDMLTLWSGR